ncbi:uncharacterized protein I303_105583 [Kwoniella dejecticola CBS 10117]|uniref:IMS import disulfide relay-system CHCH-CHCH-like Cx9C domain-containing protein n=1 Tax=Kwoniella dejecticola CBS 10117 TaxID=1296121 RepID=A0A1A6A231_9TREE|nr:uncharacterized protein I303_04974 [Kwoniella dejecticola CBS 10117]OBR84117.1 hypothetical protein I303_04974 [Kwoniella dejecticola CBS 10117]
MDLSYNLVASKCAEQMAKYQECVLKNQAEDWNTICRPEGKALAACADASVPHLAELKSSCSEQIFAYRQCLDKHAAQEDDVISQQCGGLMKNLWECSEKTMKAIEEREGTAKLV